MVHVHISLSIPPARPFQPCPSLSCPVIAVVSPSVSLYIPYGAFRGSEKVGRNRRFVIIGVDGYGGETMVSAGISLFHVPYVGRFLFILFFLEAFTPDSYPFLSYHFHHRNISSFQMALFFSRSHRLDSPLASRINPPWREDRVQSVPP